MKIGIVGSEGSKFTPDGEKRAKHLIRSILTESGSTVVSGRCHLGGIDIWAEEIGKALDLELEIYPPAKLNWSEGYKPRNLQIAKNSDIIYCISVDKLPPGYKGMTFKSCYHCEKAGRSGTDHVKSGGCWTVLQAIKAGKQGKWITVEN